MYRKIKYLAGADSARFLCREMYHYRWYSLLLPILASIFGVSLSYLTILLPKLVLDAVGAEWQFIVFFKKILVLGAVFAAVTLGNLMLHTEISKVSQTFLFRRMKALWEKKMLSVDYEAFLAKEGKVKIEKARNAISSPNQGVVEFLEKRTGVLEAFSGLIVYSVIVGRLHGFILLLLVVLFVVELLLGLGLERKKQSLKEEKARANRRLNYMAYGTKGMKEGKDIRIYSMLPMLREITRAVVRDKETIETKVWNRQFVRMLITAGIIFVRDGIAYLFLIRLYFATDMSVGDFSMYFSAVTGIGIWLTKLSASVSEYQEVRGYVSDFYDFMQMPEAKSGGKIEQLETPVSFEFKDVSYSYGEEGEKTSVIQKFNLCVNPGERIAIVGVNGAGKTTLIKLLCGMLSPDEGEIRMNGTDISKLEWKEYFNLFAAVFQKSKLLPVSIADNIMFGGAGDESRMWHAIRQAGLEEKIKSLPYKEATCLVRRITDGTELSGGQEQSLLLARALYKDAPVLVLDEPTAALDPLSENEIYQKYHMLTEGKTAFFVSHRLASTRFCDRIIFLENGAVAETGTHEELMRQNGKYADMFRVQSKYYREGEVG